MLDLKLRTSIFLFLWIPISTIFYLLRFFFVDLIPPPFQFIQTYQQGWILNYVLAPLATYFSLRVFKRYKKKQLDELQRKLAEYRLKHASMVEEVKNHKTE